MTTAEATPATKEASAAKTAAVDDGQTPTDELDELIDFLSDPRPEIRLEACKLVEGLTGDAGGRERLSAASAKLLPPLLRRATEGDADDDEDGDESPPCPPSSRPALAALVNLSQDPNVAREMLELGAVQRAMDSLRERGKRRRPEESATGGARLSGTADPIPRSEMLLMLLSNLTALEEGSAALLQLGKGAVEGFNLAVLLHQFLEGEAHGVAALLANASRLEDGRRLLVGPSGGFGAVARAAFGVGGSGGVDLSPSSLPASARRASAAALRNCCLAASRDGTLSEIARETEALASMLRALCGDGAGAGGGAGEGATTSPLSAATESTLSTKDPDPGVRAALAEAILVLADDEEHGRPKLWELNAPELLRKGYEDEEDPETCEALERTAEIFLAGAGGVEEVVDEGEGDGGAEDGEEEEGGRE